MADLDEILAAQRLATAAEEFRRVGDALQARGCLLFGPGVNGRQTARSLRATADAPAAHAFVSDLAADVGCEVEGLPVLSRAAALAEFGAGTPVVNCVYRADVTLGEVMSGLRASGFERVWSLPHLASAFPESLPSVYGYGGAGVLTREAGRVKAAHGALADPVSRQQFASLIEQRISLDFSRPRDFDPAIYFPAFLGRSAFGDPDGPFVFVDCGAYVGDTLETLPAWTRRPGDRAVALEPDPASFARLCEAVGRLDGPPVDCIKAAAGAADGSIGFMPLGNEASRVTPDGDSTRLAKVDTVLADLGLRASYIKYDVEGFERDAIEGSMTAIVDDAAGLAVSVYHRPDDLWDILLRLHEIQPRYRFHLREHGPDGVDTVLYALPAS